LPSNHPRMRPAGAIPVEHHTLGSPSDCFARCVTQDNYFWWQSYETMRRLALTSLVVVVKIIDPDFAVLYVLLVACISLVVQAYFTPFKEDVDDILSITFMANEFLLAVAMLCEQHWVGWSGSSTSGMIISGITSGTIVFALYRAEVVSKVTSIARVAISWAWAFVHGRSNEVAPAASGECQIVA
jgi:hypothetical protein